MKPTDYGNTRQADTSFITFIRSRWQSRCSNFGSLIFSPSASTDVSIHLRFKPMSEQFSNQIIEIFALVWCFGCAWALIVLFCWSAWQTCCQGIQQLKRLHGIPCSRCAYFTGDHRLKCTVHPYTALSEDALDCVDFELARSHLASVPSRPIKKEFMR